jgi:hypothetical protein
VSTYVGTRSVIGNVPTLMSPIFKLISIVSLCVVRMLHALMLCGIQRSYLIFVTEVEYFYSTVLEKNFCIFVYFPVLIMNDDTRSALVTLSVQP